MTELREFQEQLASIAAGVEEAIARQENGQTATQEARGGSRRAPPAKTP